MAEFDKFNPDVQQVGIPNFNVTKPISQPEANKSLGTLFSGIGTAVKDAGELFKEGVKASDFNNKQEIQNKVLIDANAERDQNIEVHKILDDQVRGTSIGSASPLDAASIDKSVNNKPGPLQNLPRQVQTMAAARADQSQLDVYYKGRIDEMAKRYRATYPGYKDYVDHVFSQAGFGNPANEYLHALQTDFLKVQAQIGNKNTQALAIAEEGIKKGYPGFSEHMISIQAGQPGAAEKVFRDYNTYSNQEYQRKTLQDNLSTTEAFKKNRVEATSSVVTSSVQGRLGTELSNTSTPNAIGSIIKEMDGYALNPSTINTDRLHEIDVLLGNHMNRIKNDMEVEGNTPHPSMVPSANGDLVPDGKTYKNINMMGPDAYHNVVNQNLDVLNRMREDIHNGQYGMAKFTANLVQGRKDDFASSISGNKDIAGDLAMLDYVKGYPEWARTYFTGMLSDKNRLQIGDRLKSAADSWALRFSNPNPPSPKEALDTLGKGGNDAAANKYILNQVDNIINPKTPVDIKKNLTSAFFGSDNQKLTEKMSPSDRAAFFQKVSSPEFVSSIKTLGPDKVKQHTDWVNNEFGEVLFKKDINSLNDFPVDPKIRFTFNDRDNTIGLDVGSDKNVHLKRGYAVPGAVYPGDFGAHARIDTLVRTVNRLNGGIQGVANVAKGNGGDEQVVRATIMNALQSAGFSPANLKRMESEAPSASNDQSFKGVTGGVALAKALYKSWEIQLKLLAPDYSKGRSSGPAESYEKTHKNPMQ